MKKVFFLLSLVISGIVHAQTGNVGIGTTAPQARLHVADSSVLFSAAGGVPSNTGSIPASGGGRRTMWYSGKAAFRTGFVGGTFWDKDSVGNYSFAAGFNTKATGLASTAFGNSTDARGDYATSLGAGSLASGYAATASGENTIANGFYSTALGQQSIASGSASTAFGEVTIASGSASTAFGQLTIASGLASVASGQQTAAQGDLSFAAGQSSAATASVASAIGFLDTATGNTSVALGGGLYTRSWGEVAVGTYNQDYTAAAFNSINPADRVFVVGNGTSPSARSNALTVLKNGNVGIGVTNPTQKLDVAGTVNASSFTGDGSALGNVVNTSGNQLISGVKTFSGNLLANANVGIGTTTPTQKLDITGNANITNTLFLDASNSNNGDLSTGVLAFGQYGTGEAIGSKRTLGGNRYGLDFYTNGFSRMSVTGGGNVGIGTTTPTQKLDVAGTVNATSINTSSFTGTSNMVAVAYGTVVSNATNSLLVSSGNCTLNHPSAGLYTISFNSSNLSGTNIANLAVTATLFAGAPGFVSWSGATGVLNVYTFNSSGVATDRGFSFVMYKP